MKVILVRSRSIDSTPHRLAESLSKNGHTVTLLVWDRQNNFKEENRRYKVHRFTLRAPYDKWTAMLYLPFWWIYEFYFLISRNVDVIHVCDLDTLWPAVIAKIIKRKYLFYIIYDFYANNIPDGKFYLTFLRYLLDSTEKFGIKFTDTLFLVDKSRYEEIKGAKINKLVYIYNSPPDIYDLISDLKKSNDSKFKMSIFYGGLLLQSRGLKYIIEVLKQLDDIKLVVAGTGQESEFLRQISKDYDNVEYLGWLPTYKDILMRSLEFDVIIRFSDPNIPKTKYESPNKLFEAMMCEKPIIVSDYSAMADIVREEKCGLVVTYGDIESIKKAFLKLKNDESLRRNLGKNGRTAYETKYSWKIMEKRLLSAYKDLNEDYHVE